MGIHFSKTKKILPGVYINVSTSGSSVSVGPNMAKVNISKHGIRANLTIPGTGISLTKKLGRK